MPSTIEKSIFSSGGKTCIGISADGTRFYAVNKNGLTKVLPLDKPEEEPDVVETCKDPSSLAVVSNSQFVVTSLKGDVYLCSVAEAQNHLLLRCALPIRDVALVHNGKTAAVGGDDLELILVGLADGSAKTRTTVTLEDQVRHLSYNQHMSILAVSQVNGSIHFYSMNSATPHHIRKLDGYIGSHFYNDNFQDKLLQSINSEEAEDIEDGAGDHEYCDQNRVCTRVAWSPQGLQFAIPCEDRSVKIFSLKDYSLSHSLSSPSIKSQFADLSFSPQTGAFIAAVDLRNRVTIWDASTGEIHFTKELPQRITNICWQLQPDNLLDLHLGTWTGDIVVIRGVAENRTAQPVPPEKAEQPQKQNGLFVSSDDEGEEAVINGSPAPLGEGLGRTIGQDDDPLGSEGLFTDEEDESSKRKTFGDEDDFIDDDDGAGYVNKRPRYTPPSIPRNAVRAIGRRPRKFRYRPFSQGATPFGSSDRRYLTMNNIGYACTVRSGDGGSSLRSTVTISFFDLGRFKEYHFEDLFNYDVCALTEEGALFAQSKLGQLHYRAHNNYQSSWTKKIPLQRSEKITAAAATPKRIIVGTSFGYIRTFNQFGIPLGVEKMAPVAAIAAHEFKVFAVHYSLHHGITYTLFEQDPKTQDRYFQRESSLPITLPSNLEAEEEFNETFSEFNPLGIKSLFFSAYGDPCIFGFDDVLLVLSKWRSAAQSRWVPLLDAQLELWKMSNGKDVNDVHVWPLGLTHNILNHILVKGYNIWPEFPMPLPSEMEVRVPLLVKDQVEVSSEGKESGEVVVPASMAAEEEFLRSKILGELLSDTLEHEGEVYGNENQILMALAGAYDKSLLRLFAAACSEQEVSKAESLALELKQDKALNAAAKVAERAELMTLVKKVNDIREARFEQQLGNT
ncbi:chromatin-binding protein CTF4 [Lachancea thermotolerans CBS 6340]|uniref:KLTH0F14322p n=1 Tax=Lachancea thermotolerans (strain ATCC 56472 / CBS 6340 / NRRL Y-8284) TaxID=559295 RepID=C5DJ85_LACTC|nr:KLTH0F14322p [Lachancea thermotolerans CBS 6340]CAR24374.1 KLTH0F14322p [Lachancea thermotolerans CBS 6340]